jgi:hypothetical protein
MTTTTTNTHQQKEEEVAEKSGSGSSKSNSDGSVNKKKPEEGGGRKKRPNYWPDSVESVLPKLEQGMTLRVTWIDASESAEVFANSSNKIPNHNVESVCKSTGTFFGLIKGKKYGDTHLVFVRDVVDRHQYRVESVPLCLVKAIEILGEKVTLLMKKFKGRKKLHFKDGSTKLIGLGRS